MFLDETRCKAVPHDDGLRPYMDEHTLAEYLSISVLTLRKWRLTGKGPVYRKFSSAVRYKAEDVLAYEESAARHSTSDPGPGAR